MDSVFGRFRRKRESPENSPQRTSDGQTDPENVANPAAAAEGFLCPVCMQQFPSPEILQTHFSSAHDDDTSSNISNQSDHLEEHVKELSNSVELQNKKLELFEEQLKSSEDTRAMVTSEVLLLRQQLSNALTTLNSLKQQKESTEHKAASMAQELAALRADYDDMKSHYASSKTMINQLQSDIGEKKKLVDSLQACLGGVDDVDAMRHELTSAQQMMNEITLTNESEREKYESELGVVRTAYGESLSTNEDLRRQVAELNEMMNANSTEGFKKIEEANQDKNDLVKKIEQLHRSLSEKDENLIVLEGQFSDGRKLSEELVREKDKQLNDVNVQCSKMANEMREKESTIEDLRKRTDVCQTQYQAEVIVSDDLRIQTHEMKSSLEEKDRLLENKESRLSELKQELVVKKESMTRLEEERAELYGQIEKGEGVETAIHQLKEENTSLQSQIETLGQTAEAQAGEYETKLEICHRESALSKRQNVELSDKLQKLDSQCNEKSAELSELGKKFAQIQTELLNKNELLISVEGSKESLRMDLDGHISTLQNVNTDLKTDVEQLQSNIANMETEHRTATESSKRGHAAEVTDLQDRIDKLVSTHTKQKEEIESQLSNTESKLKLSQESCEEFGKTVAEMRDSEDSLHRELRSVKDKNASLETNVSEFEDAVKALTEEVQEVRRKLESSEQSVKIQTETMLELEEKLNTSESDRGVLERSLEVSESTNDDFRKRNDELETRSSQQAVDFTNRGDNYERLLEQKDGVLKDLQTQVEISEKKLAQPCRQCRNYEQQVVKLQDSNKNLDGDKVGLLSTIEDHRAKLEAVEEVLKKTEDLLRQSEARCDQLTASKTQLEQEKQETLSSLQQAIAQRDRGADDGSKLKEKFDATSEQLSVCRAECDALQTQVKESEKLSAALQGDIAAVRAGKDEEITSLEDAKKLLISQQVELKRSVERLEAEVSTISTDLENTRTETDQLRIDTTEQADKLQSEIADKQRAVKDLQRQVTSDRETHEIQLAALNENITALRGDITVKEDQLRSAKNTVSTLERQKRQFEDDKKVTAEQLHTVLERLSDKGRETENVKLQCFELKKKFDDATAAMLELGRENQTLQMESARLGERKWADDERTYNCMDCDKPFSVTMRKHHCRNCGNIYCNECSSRTAPTHSSKKPVRVCEKCFQELALK